ncbi:MAG: 2Fe-2S iron-sulfur cluster binding domain-containing protein [Bdellovibrio sp.]|nr:2Fe-2S iron-sulfur cluster binding domain-containing protein [Bdellovibrio sp.]
MKIKFMPMNVECDVDPSKSLLQIAKENGLKIKSICNGVPSCAECRVRITSGDNSIPEPSKAELSLIGTSYFLDGRRLSCQVRCFGPVTVDLTEQLNKVDTQKKVRGFKQKDQKEISAVQDTMILSPVEAQAQVQKAAEKATEQAQQAQEKKNQPARAAQQSRPQNQNSNQNPRHGNQGQKTQNADGAKNLNQSNQQRQGQNPNAKKANHPNQNGPRNPNQNQKPQQAQQNRNQNQNRNSNQQQSKPDAVAKPETSGDVASLAKKPVDS